MPDNVDSGSAIVASQNEPSVTAPTKAESHLGGTVLQRTTQSTGDKIRAATAKQSDGQSIDKAFESAVAKAEGKGAPVAVTKPALPKPPEHSVASKNEEVEDASGQDDEDVENIDATKIERHKVKVNGKESEVTLDELKSGYQTHQAATEKFQAAAEKEKHFSSMSREIQETRQLAQSLVKNPQSIFEFAEALGISEDTIEELVVEKYRGIYEFRNMSPEQQAFQKLQRDHEALQHKMHLDARRQDYEYEQVKRRASVDKVTQTYLQFVQSAGIQPTDAQQHQMLTMLIEKGVDPELAWQETQHNSRAEFENLAMNLYSDEELEKILQQRRAKAQASKSPVPSSKGLRQAGSTQRTQKQQDRLPTESVGEYLRRITN